MHCAQIWSVVSGPLADARRFTGVTIGHIYTFLHISVTAGHLKFGVWLKTHYPCVFISDGCVRAYV